MLSSGLFRRFTCLKSKCYLKRIILSSGKRQMSPLMAPIPIARYTISLRHRYIHWHMYDISFHIIFADIHNNDPDRWTPLPILDKNCNEDKVINLRQKLFSSSLQNTHYIDWWLGFWNKCSKITEKRRVWSEAVKHHFHMIPCCHPDTCPSWQSSVSYSASGGMQSLT